MTINTNPRRGLAAALALILAVPLFAGKGAIAQTPPDCLSVMNTGATGRLTIDLPSAPNPNEVRVTYILGGPFYTVGLNPFINYVMPAQTIFPVPPGLLTPAGIAGTFSVPATAGEHSIFFAFDLRSFDGLSSVYITCVSRFSVTPYTTTSLFTKSVKVVLNPGVGGSGTLPTALLPTTTIIKAVPTAPLKTLPTTTTSIAPTSTISLVTTTVLTTTLPVTTTTLTQTSTAPATTVPEPTTTRAPIPSTTVAPVPNRSAVKNTKKKRATKKRKSTKKTKRPATTVKR